MSRLTVYRLAAARYFKTAFGQKTICQIATPALTSFILWAGSSRDEAATLPTLKDVDIAEHAIAEFKSVPPQLMLEANIVQFVDARDGDLIRLLGVGGNSSAIEGPPTPQIDVISRPPPRILSVTGSNQVRQALTWTINEEQFRILMKAFEQRRDVEVTPAGRVTTLSGRRVQMKVVNNSIATNLDSIAKPTQPIEDGLFVDLIPEVAGDSNTIRMAILPTLKQFAGYILDHHENLGDQTPQQGANVSSWPAIPADLAPVLPQPSVATAFGLSAQKPVPVFRERQVKANVAVRDGETGVVAVFSMEDATPKEAKIPLLGDLPIAGKLFRPSTPQKKTILVFVTATLIDPS